MSFLLGRRVIFPGGPWHNQRSRVYLALADGGNANAISPDNLRFSTALISMLAFDADAGGAGCGIGNHRGRDGACAVAGQTVNVTNSGL